MAVQIDPMKPTLKAPGAKRLKLKYDDPLSNFPFIFNLRRHIPALVRGISAHWEASPRVAVFGALLGCLPASALNGVSDDHTRVRRGSASEAAVEAAAAAAAAGAAAGAAASAAGAGVAAVGVAAGAAAGVAGRGLHSFTLELSLSISRTH
jgi:hypothetical protein